MLAIIPARGGSKGLPGKNIKKLDGKPLIAYTITAALNSKEITRVIVSTDDIKISEISKQYGAEVPFLRPKELATDTAKSIDTYIYTIEKLEEVENYKVNDVLILQPTSPFRTSNDIDSAINLYKLKSADSVVSYCKEDHPIIWHKYLDGEGRLESIFEGKIRNRQEERPSYYPNGAIYIFKKEIIKSGIYYTKKSFAYLMPRNRSVDIDTIEDFRYAEFLIKQSNA